MNTNEASNDPLPSLAIYNPALLKKEELIAQFVARRPLLGRLLEDLRRSGSKGGYQHHLIIGPRGSGKTMLLRRLRYAIEDDAELSSRWLPLIFPEEQYNVSRLSDLWVNCLEALSDMLERRNREDDAEALDDQIEKLPADDEKRRAQAALDLLIGWAKKENRALVLLFDNSDLIFDRLSSDHWAIREVFSADNHLLFIGATSAPIEATYNHEGAFYDFFKTHEVRGLTEQETRDVIFNLAQLRHTPHVVELLEREPGRIRTLNLLTGGNLRITVALYQVLARGSDDSIRTDIEQLLDQYTPLYKHRFEALPQQLQQIVDALALNWDPATAAALAEKLRLETNVVSAGLNRLANDGVVEKTPSPPGEKMFFQITERFFNIWYLMRASRRVRRRLIWLVEFLKIFYGSVGLRLRAHRLIHESPAPESDQSRRAEMALAYARAIEEPDLRRALENEGIRSLMSCRSEERQSIREWFDFDGEDSSLKQVVDRFQTLRELSEKIEAAKGELPEDVWTYLIAAPSLSWEEKKKKVEEISRLGLDEYQPMLEQFSKEAKQLTETFGEEACQKLFEAIRNGDMDDGADVDGADAAAIKWKDDSLKVIARLAKFNQTKDESLLSEVETILPDLQSVHLWLSWAEKIAETKEGESKLRHFYQRIIELAGRDARAWYRVGKVLKDHLKRFEESEAAYRKAIELDPNFAWAWANLGNLLQDHLKRFEESETAYRKAVELDPNFAVAWANLGNLLRVHLKRFEESEAAYRKAVELDPNFAWAWANLGYLLQVHLKRFEESEAAYRKAIELDPNFAGAWANLGNLLQDHLKRFEESEAAYRKAIELDPNFAWAWANLGYLLQDHLKRFEESEAAYRKAIELKPDNAAMWNFLGNLLGNTLNRHDEAEAAFQKAIELEGNNARYLNSLAWMQYFQNRALDEAELHSRRSVELEPENLVFAHTLACILAKQGNWEEASVFARKFIVESDDEYRERYWADIVAFFRDAVVISRTKEAVALLDETEYGERWRPLREALQAIAEDNSTYLLRVAPEVRQPAEEIVAMLLPEGVKLGTSPKSARARQTRRKRSLS